MKAGPNSKSTIVWMKQKERKKCHEGGSVEWQTKELESTRMVGWCNREGNQQGVKNERGITKPRAGSMPRWTWSHLQLNALRTRTLSKMSANLTVKKNSLNCNLSILGVRWLPHGGCRRVLVKESGRSGVQIVRMTLGWEGHIHQTRDARLVVTSCVDEAVVVVLLRAVLRYCGGPIRWMCLRHQGRLVADQEAAATGLDCGFTFAEVCNAPCKVSRHAESVGD